MQQQQRPRDRIAQMQQMSGSSEFQPQRRDDKPKQMGEGGSRAPKDDALHERRSPARSAT